MRNPRKQRPKAFTLVEVLIVMGIFAVLSSMVLVRYNRGNEDSLLTRQVAITIADLRLTQELTAAGKTVQHCTTATGKLCNQASDCPSDTCSATSRPAPGGLGVLFACPKTASGPVYTQQQLAFAPLGKSSYTTYADTVQCGTGVCYEPSWAVGQWTEDATDGMVSSYYDPTNLRGDPLVEMHTLQAKVELRDLQMVESETNVAFRCTSGARADGGSPWNGKVEPTHNDAVPETYPLQALVRFQAPDGRKVVISDNISSVTPADASYGTQGKAWGRIDVLLGFIGREVDCRAISITKEGVISQRTDADCNLAT